MEKKKKSDKSKLVKRHLEHESCDSYIRALGKDQKGTGVYVLYSGAEIHYIGLSTNSLRRRISKHAKRDRHRGHWDNFSFYQITRKQYIKDIESLLLRIYRPEGNKIGGRFKSKYNLNHRGHEK